MIAQNHAHGNGRPRPATPSAADLVRGLYHDAGTARELSRWPALRGTPECRRLEEVAADLSQAAHELGLRLLRDCRVNPGSDCPPAPENTLTAAFVSDRLHEVAGRAASLAGLVLEARLTPLELARLALAVKHLGAGLAEVDSRLRVHAA